MDAGISTLSKIHKTLQIDEEFTERRPSGFAWWAHRLAHHVDARPPIDDDGIVLHAVTSSIPVLRDVKAPAEVAESVLGRLNALAISSSYLYEPDTREVISFQRGLVHEQTLDWRPQLLAAQFMIQLCEAETVAWRLAKRLKGRIAASAHPEQGPRRQPDDMLNVVTVFFRPVGEKPSKFLGAFEFETIRELTERLNAFSAGATEAGLAIEVPFDSSTALIQVLAGVAHPSIGSGLGVFALLPDFAPLADCARLANWLNRRDTQADTLDHHLGSWCVKETGKEWAVGHAQFIPSALHRPGLATDAATLIIRKLRRVNRLLNPNVKPTDVIAVVADSLSRFIATGRPT